MNSEQVYNKIKEIYSTESGKKYILHLMRSFLPIEKSSYVWDLEKGRCCITNQKLIGKSTAFEKFSKNAKDLDKEKVEKAFREERIGFETEFQIDRQFDGLTLAIGSDRTDKNVSLVALEQLKKFVEDNRQDKLIHSAIIDEKKSFKEKKSKSATTKLGDFQALIDLRNKLK